VFRDGKRHTDQAFNRAHLKRNGNDLELAARIRSFETAFQMQWEAPAVFDLSRESDETFALYGLQRGQTDGFAWQCLVARRLAERGVRFIELIDTGAGATTGFVNWDAHQDMSGHAQMARNVDRPIAALLRDLKQRGMLEETLVVWATEFGRTATADGAEGKGRAHHPHAFTELAISMVRAGQEGGFLEDVLRRIADFTEHQEDLKARVVGALAYPIFLAVLGVTVLTALIVFFVPQVSLWLPNVLFK